MSKNDFFREIEHTPVSWRRYQLHVPLFYQDIMFINASILAPTKNIRAILPSHRLKPYRIMPNYCALSITAYQYRESDIGPYHELSIGVPVTIDEETPLFSGSLRKMPSQPKIYIHRLPVTTEIAREVGAEFAGYPKFVAEIDFVEEDEWISCTLQVEDQIVLRVRARKLALQPYPRLCINPLTTRGGYILRSEFVISEREMGYSKKGDHFQLEFGEHPMAEELKAMNLGRVLGYGYCPHAQGILTPVFESLAG